MSKQEEKTFYCQVGEHTFALEEYETNLHYCGYCHRAFCNEHAGNLKVQAGNKLSCQDHIPEVHTMNARHTRALRAKISQETSTRTIPTDEALKVWYEEKRVIEQEVATLKQRVHHLECLLDDCARELASLQTRFGVDLREFIGKIVENISESEEEKRWEAGE